MSSLNILLKNSLFLMVANYLGMGMNFLLTVFLARYLGADSFGVFMTALTFVFFGGVLTDFGIQPVIVRNVSKNRSELPRYFINCLVLTLFTALVSWVVIAIMVFILGYSAYLKAIILISATGLLINAVSMVSIAVIRALEKMEIISTVSGIYVLCYSVVGICMVVLGLGVKELIVWGVIAGAFNAIALYMIVKRMNGNVFSWKVEPDFCFGILKQSAPIAAIRSLNMLTNRVDILMLSVMLGNAPVGFYSAALKIVSPFRVPALSINNAIMPHISSRMSSSQDDVKRIYNEVVRVLIFMILPVAIIITVSSENVVQIVFGQSFVENDCAVALQILIWGLFFDIISGPAGMVIINLEDRLLKFAWFAGAITLLNVILNLFMIPVYGIIGASISTLICSFVRFIVKVAMVHKLMERGIIVFKSLAKPSICAVCFYFILYVLEGQHVIIGLTTGLITYFTGLFFLKAITSEDLSLIRKAVYAGAGKIFKT